jgi:hypothetical protein
MKKNEIKIGNLYTAKVSDRVVTVRIDSTNSHGGWNATNTATGKRIRIKSAQRLREAVTEGQRSKKSMPEPAGQTPGEQGIAAAQADAKAAERENARLAEERAAAPDGLTASERAMDATAEPKKRRAKQPAEPKPKRTSALDAAATVLKDAAKPLNATEMIQTMAERGLWSSPNGKTPAATLYAAIIREIATKGDAARFRKVERGQFAANG